MNMEEAVLLVMVTLVTLGDRCHCVTREQEVSVGDTAVIQCASNDDHHRFQFWQVHSHNTIIGPTNTYDRDKYKSDVLSGNLTIRGVSSDEHGLYSCVSKHISDDSYHMVSVNLNVKKDWEQVFETDPYTNIFRISILAAISLAVVAIVLVCYVMQKDKATRFTALADEEMAGPSSERPATTGSLQSDLDLELPRPSSHVFSDVRLK